MLVVLDRRTRNHSRWIIGTFCYTLIYSQHAVDQNHQIHLKPLTTAAEELSRITGGTLPQNLSVGPEHQGASEPPRGTTGLQPIHQNYTDYIPEFKFTLSDPS